MTRVVLLGAVGLAVIMAALALNYAITREEAINDRLAMLETVPDAAVTQPAAAPPDAPLGERSGSPLAGPAGEGAGAGAAELPATDPAATGPVRPDFDVVQVNPSGGMVMAGRAAPYSDVTVIRDGEAIGTVTADGRGEWVLVPEVAVEPGSHEFGVMASQPGQQPVESEDVVVVVVPEPREDVAGRQQAETGRPLAVALPRDGQGGATVLQAPGPPALGEVAEVADGSADPGMPGEGIADGSLVLDSLTYDTEGAVAVGGRAEPGTRVEVYLGEQRIAAATADADGRWEAAAEQPVPEGMHRLRVEQVEPDGDVVARVESPFLRAGAAETFDGTVVVQPGNSLWRIARRLYGRGIRYTLIFSANQSQIDDPDLIYPGQVFVVPPLAGGP